MDLEDGKGKRISINSCRRWHQIEQLGKVLPLQPVKPAWPVLARAARRKRKNYCSVFALID